MRVLIGVAIGFLCGYGVGISDWTAGSQPLNDLRKATAGANIVCDFEDKGLVCWPLPGVKDVIPFRIDLQDIPQGEEEQ